MLTDEEREAVEAACNFYSHECETDGATDDDYQNAATLRGLLERTRATGSVYAMTHEERTMFYFMAFYVFIDGLPKCVSFILRVAGWLEVK